MTREASPSDASDQTDDVKYVAALRPPSSEDGVVDTEYIRAYLAGHLDAEAEQEILWRIFNIQEYFDAHVRASLARDYEKYQKHPRRPGT